MEIYGSARTVLCWNDSAASVGASGRLIRREPAYDLKTRRRNWLPGPVGPRGDLALRRSPMDDDVQRRRERQGVPMPQGTGNFGGWQGITPRPRVLPYQLVGGKRPAGSPAER